MITSIRLRLFILSFLMFVPAAVLAQPATDAPAPDQYFRAKITRIIDSGVTETDEGQLPWQQIEARILNGSEEGTTVIIDHGKLFSITPDDLVADGDTVVLTKPGASPKPNFYYITDVYRANRLLYLGLVFFALVAWFGRGKGLTSMLGLGLSILVIFYGMVPAIVSGRDPLLVAVFGCLVITFVSLYLSHGFSKRVSVAVLATSITLGLAYGINILFVFFARLNGRGTEEAFYLQQAATTMDMRGLLLAGILLGVMGVLDDVTTAQSAAVAELHDANPKLSIVELYRRGLTIGHEHIASLVNTLVLAYVGVSFPMILLFTLNSPRPLWLILNSNFIAEEVVRTLVGSSALVLAVPITTLLAAYFFGRKKV